VPASNAGTAPAIAPELSYLTRAAAGVGKLQTWYIWSTGRWQTTNWWGAANSTTVLVNYSKLTGSSDHQPAIENTFYVNAPNGFVTTIHYDDEGWWALAWIDAYDWTGNPDYLTMASSIFDDMTNGWDEVRCGGGVWWSKAGSYKNAVTNELFLSLAAHLANRVSDPDRWAGYVAWANLEWQWFSHSGMINSDNLINDGLTTSCENNQQTTWTYNQGVILGGLAELYQQNPDASLAQAAQNIALAAINQLTDVNGILHEPCEPGCNGDRVQFKGIFVRNLMALNDAFPDARYVQFVRANADSIWNQDQGPDYEFGLVWSGPFSPDSNAAASQTSALDALIAAAEMSTGTPIRRANKHSFVLPLLDIGDGAETFWIRPECGRPFRDVCPVDSEIRWQ
jgi:predicted alpha-1,6-mannanase (GH76 family)